MSGTALKYVMLVLMVLDHIKYFVPHRVWLVFHLVSRCVAPFFAYMAVEGFVHTRSRLKYIGRLFFWAGLMAGGNWILNTFVLKEAFQVPNNIILTFAVSVLVLYLLELPRELALVLRILGRLGAAALLMLAFVTTEGGYFLPFLMLITYYGREQKMMRNALYVALSAFVFVLEGNVGVYRSAELGWELLENVSFLFITFLPFTYLYNGKRGKNTRFTKYSFYVFYPLHVWLIALTAQVLRG